MIEVELPDGSKLEMEENSTVEDVAYKIGEGLGNDTKAGKINGKLVAKEETVSDGDKIHIVTPSSEEYLEVLRHSAAHVFAQALKRIHPEAKLTIGPSTDEGFYYDVADVELEQEDLREIEEEMEKIIEEDLEIEQEFVSRDEAEKFFEDNLYKRQILEEEAGGTDKVSFYEQGEFKDLCKGPHVDSTGEIGGFKLLNIAGAYWRGDEENEMLTRVYGTAFADESDLEEFLELREEAQKRDHRKIGKEMNLFSIPEVTGPGLPLYHPNGQTVISELRGFVDNMNKDQGYDFVETPHLFRTELWKESGHYENYRDDMFLLEVGDEEYGLKPMNCPGHATIFKQQSWSYKDLPVRYAENGKVYRKEQRGELSGLSRVWSFTIDDAHLFVRPDQIKQEILQIMENIEKVLETFNMEAEYFLATRPDKSVGSDEIWNESEDALREVLEELDLEYGVEEGDGAFYGPKIDVAFEDALGREWDGPTVQLDFNMPERFDLTYTGENNEDQRPVMIHRALYGSYERFMMVLIEQFEGSFPTWLAPEQVRILPVSDDSLEYAREVREKLDGFRVEVEDRSWTVGKKIQNAHDEKVPYMLIVGDDEEENRTVSVRDRFENEESDVPIEEFGTHLAEEVADKRLEPDFIE
ncbi:threonine--tRNA ligase [Candidatus Nanohalococcus occultus]|uniref:threonine--tRNA ligase n=1 Tax=Candidatus Nanohalococcus occultus TaxID=2978047 RepID=UPI0039E07E10